jgi:hypothetical protein
MEAWRTDLELELRGFWTAVLPLELKPMDLPNFLDVVGITTSDAFADT